MIYNFNLREGSLEALLDTGHSIVFVAGNMKTNFYPAPAPATICRVMPATQIIHKIQLQANKN